MCRLLYLFVLSLACFLGTQSEAKEFILQTETSFEYLSKDPAKDTPIQIFEDTLVLGYPEHCGEEYGIFSSIQPNVGSFFSGAIIIFNIQEEGLVLEAFVKASRRGRNFGQHLAIYEDRIVVGSPYFFSPFEEEGGLVSIYKRVNGTWTLEHEISVLRQAQLFGKQVYLWDSNTLLIADDWGQIFTYTYNPSNNTWNLIQVMWFTDTVRYNNLQMIEVIPTRSLVVSEKDGKKIE